MTSRQRPARLLAVLTVICGGVIAVVAPSAAPAAAGVETIGQVRTGNPRLGDLRVGFSSPSRSRRIANVAGADQPLNCYDGWLQSVANGKYVAAELHYTGAGYGELRARSSSVGSWERFEFCFGIGGALAAVAIRSLANGKWVSAELQYTGALYGMLRARASGIGPWETFAAINGGLRNQTNLRFVSAELQYTGIRYGMLRARANSRGPWEEFRTSRPWP
jgi:hypothetical protein